MIIDEEVKLEIESLVPGISDGMLIDGVLKLIINQLKKQKELLSDLNEILPTALHNGHHDLIQRVKEICK